MRIFNWSFRPLFILFLFGLFASSAGVNCSFAAELSKLELQMLNKADELKCRDEYELYRRRCEETKEKCLASLNNGVQDCADRIADLVGIGILSFSCDLSNPDAVRAEMSGSKLERSICSFCRREAGFLGERNRCLSAYDYCISIFFDEA